MAWTALAPADWAQQQFGRVSLGDRRLDRRLVGVATAMACDPDGSIPRQSGGRWAGTKGAYRLFDHERVTFDAVGRPHWQQTREQCRRQPGVVLLIPDTTWLDYRAHPAKRGMGWHGSGRSGHGLFLHSVLAVRPRADAGAAVIGVAWAKVWARDGEVVGTDQQRRARRRRSGDRESLRWTEAVGEVGSPAEPGGAAAAAGGQEQATRWLHVGDRESDIYDVYEESRKHPAVGFVVRVSKDRNAAAGHDTPDTASVGQRHAVRVKDVCRQLPLLGGRRLWVRPRADRAGRWAKLSIAAGPVTLWSPQVDRTGRALRCWARCGCGRRTRRRRARRRSSGSC